MPTFETIMLVENQFFKLDSACAVLSETLKYFEEKIEPDSLAATSLVENAEHILLLLYVVNDLLIDVKPELEKAVDEFFEESKGIG